jgi:hypothetical protein
MTVFADRLAKELEELQVLAFHPRTEAVAVTPKVMFEFDIHFGFRESINSLIGQSVPSAAPNSPRGKRRLTTNDVKNDFFDVKLDWDRLELGTARFDLDHAGLQEIAQVKVNLLDFAKKLEIGCKGAKERKDLTIRRVAGHPRLFTLPNARPTFPPLFIHKLHLNGRFSPTCSVWASPQAHLTIPLSKVSSLISAIRNSIGKGHGVALTGGPGQRMGLRSDHLYIAQRRVEAFRKRVLQENKQLSDGTMLDESTFTDQLCGFVILLVSYLLVRGLAQPQDKESFGKGHLPVNVKTPFPEIFSRILTPTEQLIYKELFANPNVRKALFRLVDPLSARPGDNLLFPPVVLSDHITWDEFINWSIGISTHIPVDDLPGGGKKWPAIKTAPLVTLELRRIGFRPLYAKDWPKLIDTVISLTQSLNS